VLLAIASTGRSSSGGGSRSCLALPRISTAGCPRRIERLPRANDAGATGAKLPAPGAGQPDRGQPDSTFTGGYDGIASGLSGHEHTVVDWVLDRLLGQEPTTAREILGLVVGGQLWPELVGTLAQCVAELDVTKLAGVVALLGDRDFWPIQAPTWHAQY
jgi:hypothetical protein